MIQIPTHVWIEYSTRSFVTCVARNVLSSEYLFELGFDTGKLAHQPEVQMKKFANFQISKFWKFDCHMVPFLRDRLLF